MSAFEIRVIIFISMRPRFPRIGLYVKSHWRFQGIRDIQYSMAERVGILSLGKYSKVLMLIPMLQRIKRRDSETSIILVCDNSVMDHKKELTLVNSFLSVDELMEKEFDLFINTEPDDLSCAIASRVKTASFKGFICDEYGRKKTQGLWFKYIEQMSNKNFLNMLHYSDVLSTACGFAVREAVNVEITGITKNLNDLFAFGPYGKDNRITIDGVEWVSGFDKDGFLEYLPTSFVKLDPKLFYGLIYRAVWKCTISRTIRAGDPQRFLSLGETYLDRMVDVDRETEALCNRVFKKFTIDSVNNLVKEQPQFLQAITKIKEIAFEGQKIAREFLSAASKNVHDMTEIKDIKLRLQLVGKKIEEIKKAEQDALPLIELFEREEPSDDVQNLFPLAKSIILSFEDLFSRASFTEEIIKGVYKNIKGDINE